MTLRRLTVVCHAVFAALLLVSCSNVPTHPPSPGHLRAESLPSSDAGNIPQPVAQAAALTKPKPAAKSETFSVVVNDVKVQELLFALARDAKINVDVHAGIQGTVTLNAIDQTLPQLLNRIGKQVDMRWEFDGPNLTVMPDSPFLRTYKIDYVNMARDTSGNTTVTTQIASTGTGGSGGTGGGGGNSSLTKVDNSAKNHFWETLEKNLKDILRETDKILPEGSSETVMEHADQQSTTGTGAQAAKTTGKAAPNTPASIANSPNPASLQQEGTTVVRRTTFREAAAVIVNPESSVLIVRATSRQHEKIQEFLDQVLFRASRQVLIEATIAEVLLSNDYQQGINWGILPMGNSGVKLLQTASVTPVAGVEIGSYVTDPTAKGVSLKDLGIVSGSIKLLEAFGTVKVLSSPKLSVINNQTAVIKVIDNKVYFTVKADTTTNQTASVTTYTTTLNTVPVGFVMNVTPQISENDTVLLNIRPSISRIISYVNDPNPDLAKAGVTSQIPVIRTREMESMIRVSNGNIAVMGGLMEETNDNTDTAIPGLWNIPALGNLFVNRDDKHSKTELVIFLRPIVIRDASLTGDYRAYREQLPDKDFFKSNNGPQRQQFSVGGKTQ
ncbi:MAG: secretin N-terminal domain-containing protein [Sterolibacterium sp.]|nr:secretin N-terminal domain-containing protein [Sterolibacterium sp.]